MIIITERKRRKGKKSKNETTIKINVKTIAILKRKNSNKKITEIKGHDRQTDR